MKVKKMALVGFVAATALALPGTAFAGSISGTCNGTTGGTAGGTGLNGTVHGDVCNAP